MSLGLVLKNAIKNLAKAVLEQDGRWVFLAICAFYGIATALQQHFILTDDVYFNSLGEQVAYERIEAMLDKQKNQAWISYCFIPLVVLTQVFLITLCLNVGTLFLKDKISFTKIFSLVTKVLIVPAFFRVLMVIIMIVFYDIRTFDDIANTFSFALTNLFDIKALPTWLVYPLSTINLYEALFWVLLAYGVKWLMNMNFNKSLSFVSYTYGVGLAMWLVFLIFLQLNLQ